MSRARSFFSFPNPVNEVAARLVAAGVVTMAVTYLATRSMVVLVVLAYGFWARVLTGPRLSPLGRLVTEVVVPRLSVPPKFVSGPPKRFAQGMGVVFSTGALVAHLGGEVPVAIVLIGGLCGAALLEAALGFCLGCKVFAMLSRAGIVPASACVECSDVSGHLARLSAAGAPSAVSAP